MINAKRLAVVFVLGLAALGGAWYYRSQWKPPIEGKWLGAINVPDAQTAPPGVEPYDMEIQFKPDGTYFDATVFTWGKWRETPTGVHLEAKKFYGLNHAEAVANWTKKGKISPHTEVFLDRIFTNRDLHYVGKYLVELELGSGTSIWYKHL